MTTFPTSIILKKGSHTLPSDGSCAMEVAVLVAGYGWRKVSEADDLPDCMSRVIGAYVIGLNDAMPEDQRQRLLPFVTRMGGTRDTAEIECQRAEYLLMTAARPAAMAPGLSEAARIGINEVMALAVSNFNAGEWGSAAEWVGTGIWRAAKAIHDWSPYLDALDGALKIGNQAPPVEVARIEAAVKTLQAAE